MAACLLMATLGVCAQTHEKDSLRVISLQEVEIISTRATGTTPVAFTNVSKEQLKKQNFGQDIPYLLSFTPSVLTTSDAGAGIGYTSIRVRGTDATRINVTTNGIPMNDAESHSIFWVNTILPLRFRTCRFNGAQELPLMVPERSVPVSI